MSETITLAPAGQHSPDYREVAQAFAECVRVLNYAIAPWTGWPGLIYPADVYDVIGAIKAGAYALQQAFGQMRGFLQDRLAAGRLRLDSGGDPAAAVGAARAHLAEAAAIAAHLYHRLERAHQAMGHVAGAPSAHHGDEAGGLIGG
ncbi:MAG TPA: hypothetical protein VLW50_19870 [Streptosporangiaceae bacterium]|nr:hypothetical protein [Streptosporangiaceae bacterium]